MSDKLEILLDCLRRERERQDLKWGKDLFLQSQSDWLAALGEEFGEVAREVVEYNAAGNDKGNRADIRAKMKVELIQVAAVCLSWIEIGKLDRS